MMRRRRAQQGWREAAANPALLCALGLAGCGAEPPTTATSPPYSDVESLSVPEETNPGLEPGPHTAVWNGIRFWYCVRPDPVVEGAPVVFLHGGPGQGSQHFTALTGPTLEPTLRMVYFDQRGSGRSERPWDQDYDLPTVVEAVERLRTTLGVERISLMGHSFGGLPALEYAAAHPDRVERMVIVAGLSDIPGSTRSVCRRLSALDPEAHARALADPLPGGFCNPFATYSGPAREAYDQAAMFPDTAVARRLEEADGLGRLRNTGDVSRALFTRPDVFTLRFAGHDRISAPVLVVAGVEDHQIGLEPQRALAAALPEGSLLVVEGAGHFPHLDRPEAFAEAVGDFLAGPR